MLSIDQLPDEVLCLILKHLEKECPVLREVCWRWYRLTVGWKPYHLQHLAASGSERLVQTMIPRIPQSMPYWVLFGAARTGRSALIESALAHGALNASSIFLGAAWGGRIELMKRYKSQFNSDYALSAVKLAARGDSENELRQVNVSRRYLPEVVKTDAALRLCRQWGWCSSINMQRALAHTIALDATQFAYLLRNWGVSDSNTWASFAAGQSGNLAAIDLLEEWGEIKGDSALEGSVIGLLTDPDIYSTEWPKLGHGYPPPTQLTHSTPRLVNPLQPCYVCVWSGSVESRPAIWTR